MIFLFNNNQDKSANLQLVKQANKTLLFNLIYKSGSVSRAGLAEKTKLSPTTVSSLVAEMLEQNLVTETGTGLINTCGRKPIMLKINPNSGYVFSLEMMERSFTCYLYNMECQVVSEVTAELESYANVSEKIIKVIMQVLEERMIPEEQLYGIAISIPALIDKEAQKVIASTIIPIKASFCSFGNDKGADNAETAGADNAETAGADNAETAGADNTETAGTYNTETTCADNTKTAGDNTETAGAYNTKTAGDNAETAGAYNTKTAGDNTETASADFIPEIKKKFPSIPIILENTSSFYAYAEKEFGQYKNINHLVFIDIGTGIGAGIIIDGKLFNGSSGLSGEIGHMCIDINGPKCKCGSKGCFEVTAGIPSIKQEIMLAIMSGRNTVIKDTIQGDLNKISMDSIVDAFTNKDALTCEIIDGIAKKQAVGINNVINIFNPQAIVIGGEITALGDGFLDLIKGHLKEIELWPQAKKTSIGFTEIKKGSVNLGGAKYLLDQLMQTGNILGPL